MRFGPNSTTRLAAPLFAFLALLALAAAPSAFAALPDVSASNSDPAAPPRALRADRLLDRAWLQSRGVGAPARLAFDEEGALYVLDAAARRVIRLPLGSRLGASSADPAETGAPLAFGEDVAPSWLPSDLALDLRGSLLVLDRSAAAVAAYGRRAEPLGSRDVDPALAEESRAADARLVRDPFGDLWLLAPRERDLVPLGARLERRRSGRFLMPEEALESPVAAAFLPRGGGWIADGSLAVVRRFAPTGTMTITAAPNDSLPFAPADLATDGSGALFVADAAGGRVAVFGEGGALLTTHWLSGGGSGGRPWRPSAIAWSRDDRVAVADPSRGEIWILTVEREGTP
jgi:sugar lactone lactonase YvrE